MKKILLICFLFLTACAGVSQKPTLPLATEPSTSGGIQVFATLADFGTFEMELAPAYTRLAVLRHNAARALNKSRITRNDAISIQLAADSARAKLDEAKMLSVDNREQEAKTKLQAALEIIKLQEMRLP